MEGRLPVTVETSVVVPCRDCAKHLAQQLAALADQDFSGAWEVIVADNASSDGSRLIPARFVDRLQLRVVDAQEGTGASYTRNAGARVATGDKLLFVDADDEVAPGYVSAMSAALDSSAFVTSRVDVVTLNPQWSRSAHSPWQQESLYFLSPAFLPAAGPNVGILRGLFQSVGGFPGDFDGTTVEDIAFAWWVQLHGVPLTFVPQAVYRYRHRDSLKRLYQQTRRWGTHLPLLYKEFRSAGMPRRPLGVALRAWMESLRKLVRARSKAALARALVDLGYCVGRLRGSIRYRIMYL